MTLPATHGVLVVLNVGTDSDTWLRERIRGTEEAFCETPPRCQRVIVETYEEARRVLNTMAVVKYAKRKPYGGGWSQGVEFIK